MLKDIFMDLLLIVGIAFLGMIFTVIMAQIVDTIRVSFSRKRLLKEFEKEMIKQTRKKVKESIVNKINSFEETRD